MAMNPFSQNILLSSLLKTDYIQVNHVKYELLLTVLGPEATFTHVITIT